MTPQQFLTWQAYDLLEPIGDFRGDIQAAQICATIMNSLMMRAGAWDEDKKFRAPHFLIDFDDMLARAEAKLKEDAKAGGSTPKPEAWRHWKFLARMSVAAANADLKKQERRQQRIAEARERAERREEEKRLKRQQEADKRASERAKRAQARQAREKK